MTQAWVWSQYKEGIVQDEISHAWVWSEQRGESCRNPLMSADRLSGRHRPFSRAQGNARYMSPSDSDRDTRRRVVDVALFAWPRGAGQYRCNKLARGNGTTIERAGAHS